MLRQAPELEAKALFEHLAQSHPGGVKDGLLRTFQRRVRSWRLVEGPEKEVFFTQDHKPGEELAVDWTDMGDPGIMIEGRKLAHKLFHAVLTADTELDRLERLDEGTHRFRGACRRVVERKLAGSRGSA
jgi:hypothetical protein